MSKLNLEAVVVESSKRGVPFSDAEKAAAKQAVTDVIKANGGIPTLSNGKLAAGLFVTAIRTACKDAGCVPTAHAEKGRSWGALAHLATQAIEELKEAGSKKTKTA